MSLTIPVPATHQSSAPTSRKSMLTPTSQQQAFLDALTGTDRNIILQARAGCLAASTIIGVNRAGKSYQTSIEHLVYMFNGGESGNRKFDPCIPTQVRSVVGGIVCLATISGAVFSGIKSTHRIQTKRGFALRATADHQIFTPDGWVELGQLRAGDFIFCDGGKKTITDRVVFIGEEYEEKTYDLTMQDQYNPCFLGNGIVVHNCGKTSAILMGVDAYLSSFPGSEVLVCAYNKAIQTEVQEKLESSGYGWKDVQCQTVHSMGMSLLKYTYRPRVEEGKIWRILDELKDHESRTHPLWQFGSQIVQLVGLGKQSGVGFFDDLPIGDRSIWYDIADHYDVASFEPGVDMDAVATWAEKLYRQSLEIVDEIDFNDMVLFPLIKGLRVKYRKDLILGDECQDWSRTRQALVRMFLKNPGGRLAAVGDDKQSVYGWTGADTKAMTRLQDELDALVLPLSVTWRCPKRVVQVAQKIVPDLEAADTAPEGEVRYQSSLMSRAEFKKVETGFIVSGGMTQQATSFLDDLVPSSNGHGDAILCRNTAPLIPLAYRIIRAGIPAKVEGRKLGEGLIELVNRWSIKTTSALRNKLLDYRDREVAKWTAKGKEQKAEEAEDRVSTILAIVEECEKRGRHEASSVVEFIERLFGDDVKGAVTLCTYHRSKGREWDRVLLLEHSSRCPSRAARQEWQLEQERNLAYVAVTRAKKTLVFVG